MGRDDREMTADEAPELKRARAALGTVKAGPHAETSEAMFAAVQAQTASEDASWLGALRAKPTTSRRLWVLSVLIVIVVVTFALGGVAAFSLAPMRVGVSLGVFGALMVALSMLSLRPMHQPSLSRGTATWLVGGSLALACGLCVWPSASTSIAGTGNSAMSCLLYGLGVALPVYVAVRMLARGSWLTGLLSVLAAGLTANFVQITHCPTASTDHLLLGHFGVVAALVLMFVVWSGMRAFGMRAR